MTLAKQFWVAFRSIKELGVTQLANYAWYQVGIRTGLTERVSRKSLQRALQGSRDLSFQPLFELPSPQLLISVLGDEVQALIEEAEEICAGKIRIFGSQKVNLDYRQVKSEVWFSRLQRSFARNSDEDLDLKFFWEPARFGWVYPLARAYLIRSEERYAEKFWEEVESFLENHPPYYGVQWLSAQEVAFRMMAWVFGYHVFQTATASTEERKRNLLTGLAVHAARIPCTISYALAQNNNHLLSEAVGLMTAATVLKDHPLADDWWKQGRRWFQCGMRRQIAEDGTYVQHSTNYHRLMLQIALWARLVANRRGEVFAEDINLRLVEASRWLRDCCEPRNGRVPNLGANDGAYIQPLSQTPFEDFRPVLQAAYRAFVGEVAFAKGVWDEMSLWYGVWDGSLSGAETLGNKDLSGDERLSIRENAWILLRSRNNATWTALRSPRFFSRPSHVDLLHLDLWWEGINLACDAGTYRYTAKSPWNNALSEAFYHNTITIDGRNPMTRVGNFLWLDWAKTNILVRHIDDAKSEPTIAAEHNGYRSLGVQVRRFVTLRDEHIWVIKDRIESTKQKKCQSRHLIRLHWLIYPCEWQVFPEDAGWILFLKVNSQQIRLWLRASAQFRLCIYEMGKVVYGEGEESRVYGYTSPIYNCLQPALSVILEGREELPMTLETMWELPKENCHNEQ